MRNVLAGGSGPKLIDILQMREKHALQDRIELIGAVKPADVRNVGKVESRVQTIR